MVQIKAPSILAFYKQNSRYMNAPASSIFKPIFHDIGYAKLKLSGDTWVKDIYLTPLHI